MGKEITLFVIILFGIILTTATLNSVYGLSIPVGDGPSSITINENENIVYVTNRVSSDITVIDGATNTVLQTIPTLITGPAPSSISYIPTTDSLYVVNQPTNSISVIDANSFNLITNIPVGSFPTSTSRPNLITNEIYVANTFDNTVSVIDLTTNLVTDTISLGIGNGPFLARIDPSLNLVYVSNIFSSSFSVIDGSTKTVIDTIVLPGGVGSVGINESTNELYVANFFSNTVQVLDRSTYEVLNTITVGNSPRQAFFNSNLNQIYTNNFDSNTLSIIDVSTYSVIATVPATSPSSLWANTITNIVYVTNEDSDTLQILDILSNNPPTSNAGPNQILAEGSLVTLDGSASSDPESDPLTFQWFQISGPIVSLSNDVIVNPTFIAPNVSGPTKIKFGLIVNDGTFDSIPDEVDIVVTDLTTFDVTLSQTSSGASGSVNVGDINADIPVTLQFSTPTGSLQTGELKQAQITSSIDGSGISFDFAISSKLSSGLPSLPVDTALFYDINFQGNIDFSNPSNIPAEKLPRSQFTVSKDFVTKDKFSDGSPVIKLFLLDEINNIWGQQGDPLEPNTNKAYTANVGSNTVSVIDLSTNTILDTIPVGITPRGLAYDPINHQVYVSNFMSGTVSVIDATTDTVITTIVTGFGPFGMNIKSDTNQLYVANFGSGTISVIDTLTNTVIDTIIVGGNSLVDVTVNTNTNRAYASEFFTNKLYVIDTTTNTVIDNIDVKNGPSVVVINQNTNTIYVTQFIGGTVAAIDGITNTVIDNLTIGGSPAGMVFNPNTNLAYVANPVLNSVSVIETITNSVIGTIPVGNAPFRIDVIPDINRIYVVNGDSGTVSIIDGITNIVIDTITVGVNSQVIIANPNVSNPMRDPSTDVKDVTDEVLEYSFIGKLPHLSKFAIGGIRTLALGALAGGGGGSTGGSAPSLNNIAFDGVTTVNEDGILEFGGLVIDKIAPVNNFPTQKVKTGVPFELRLPFYEDNGVGSLQHVAVYFLQGDEKTIYDSQTSIIYEPNSSVEFSDTSGLISNVSAEGIVKSAYSVDVVFEMTFNFPTDEPIDVIVRSWDKHRRSSDIKFSDLILVEVNSPFNLHRDTSLDNTPEWSKSVQSSLTKSTTIFKEDFDGTQVTFDTENGQSVTPHTTIPLWIKNNAHWWSQDEIGNDDFVASVQYLIEKDILSVPKRHVISILETAQPAEIPNWIKLNAKWWANDSISDEEFVQSMQWLIKKGIMTV